MSVYIHIWQIRDVTNRQYFMLLSSDIGTTITTFTIVIHCIITSDIVAGIIEKLRKDLCEQLKTSNDKYDKVCNKTFSVTIITDIPGYARIGQDLLN